MPILYTETIKPVEIAEIENLKSQHIDNKSKFKMGGILRGYFMKGWSCDDIRNTEKRTKEEVRISQNKKKCLPTIT